MAVPQQRVVREGCVVEADLEWPAMIQRITVHDSRDPDRRLHGSVWYLVQPNADFVVFGMLMVMLSTVVRTSNSDGSNPPTGIRQMLVKESDASWSSPEARIIDI